MRKRRVLILDANLLLLLVIGSIDPSWIARVAKVQSFSVRDFERLSDIVSRFRTLVVTPHVLTEVSNLANDLRDEWKDTFANSFRKWIALLEERHTSAGILSQNRLFRFGITDVSLVEAAPLALILTQDGRFAAQLKSQTDTLALNLETAIALGDDLYKA